jgi:hypothetical protein
MTEITIGKSSKIKIRVYFKLPSEDQDGEQWLCSSMSLLVPVRLPHVKATSRYNIISVI